MKNGPNFATLAALIGDPARANILSALMSGKALTATELSNEAGVTTQTGSSHLRKLEDGGLIQRRHQGRHNYFTLSGDDVAQALEGLMGLAAGRGHLRTRTGPKDNELRRARVCYNHLAGEMGVQMYQAMHRMECFETSSDGMKLTDKGGALIRSIGIELENLPKSRAPMCKECLDWSMRQSHLAGRLGRAMLVQFESNGWVSRVPETRILRFSPTGEAQFHRLFAA